MSCSHHAQLCNLNGQLFLFSLRLKKSGLRVFTISIQLSKNPLIENFEYTKPLIVKSDKKSTRTEVVCCNSVFDFSIGLQVPCVVFRDYIESGEECLYTLGYVDSITSSTPSFITLHKWQQSEPFQSLNILDGPSLLIYSKNQGFTLVHRLGIQNSVGSMNLPYTTHTLAIRNPHEHYRILFCGSLPQLCDLMNDNNNNNNNTLKEDSPIFVFCALWNGIENQLVCFSITDKLHKVTPSLPQNIVSEIFKDSSFSNQIVTMDESSHWFLLCGNFVVEFDLNGIDLWKYAHTNKEYQSNQQEKSISCKAHFLNGGQLILHYNNGDVVLFQRLTEFNKREKIGQWKGVQEIFVDDFIGAGLENQFLLFFGKEDNEPLVVNIIIESLQLVNDTGNTVIPLKSNTTQTFREQISKDPQISVDMMKISELLRAQCVAGISYSQELKKILEEKLKVQHHACNLLRSLSFPLSADLREQAKKISSSYIDMDLVPLFDDERENEKTTQKHKEEEEDILPNILLDHVSQTFVGDENECIVWSMVLYVKSSIEGIKFKSVILSTPDLSFETTMRPLISQNHSTKSYPIHITTKFTPLKKCYYVDIVVEWTKSEQGKNVHNKEDSNLAFIGRVKLSPELQEITTPHDQLASEVLNSVLLDLVIIQKENQKEKNIEHSFLRNILEEKLGMAIVEKNERENEAINYKFSNGKMKHTLCVTLFTEPNRDIDEDSMLSDIDKLDSENVIHLHLSGHSISVITQFISSLNYFLPSHVRILPNPITPSTLSFFSMQIDALKKELNYITKTTPQIMENGNENVYEEIRRGFLEAQMNTNHLFAHLESFASLE